MAINNMDSDSIIPAGSDICNGGHGCLHLKHNLWRRRCNVVFVGFASEGTLARRIVDGVASMHVFKEHIPVCTQVRAIYGFSKQADRR